MICIGILTGVNHDLIGILTGLNHDLHRDIDRSES